MRGAGIDRLALDREFALWDVAAAADVDQRAWRDNRAHGHLVARERAGLVGADDRGGAERFDRGQLAHDRMGRCHAADAQAEPDCDDRRQRLRDGRDRERYCEQEQAEHDVEGEDRGVEEAGGEHQGADCEHDHAEPLAGAVQFLLQGRRLPFRGLQKSGDAADLGCHAGGDDDRTPAAVGGDRAGDRACCGGRRGWHRLDRAISFDTGTLSPVKAASSVCRFATSMSRASAGILSPASIRMMSPGTMSWVAMRCALSIAHDGRFRRGKCHQCPHGLLRARLLDEAERRIQDDDHHDDDRFIGQGGFARILQQPFHHGDHDGNQQDDDKDVVELLQQTHPPRRFRRALQLVRAICSRR